MLVECIFMNQQLAKEMEQHTYGIMNNVEDSHWWFVGRRAILESFLASIRNPQSAIRILDVGCGTGANLEMLKQFGDAEGVDVSDDALEFCKLKGLKVHKGLAESLPFAAGSFDLVTALDVVEHLDDDIAGLKEMNRVLKSDGKTLIFVPAFMWLWGVQDDISNHRIRYTREQIVERLTAAGFKIERATYANITFFLPILLGRFLMKITGIKPESENNVNISALNGFFGKIFSAEKYWLNKANFPFGVSIVIVAKKAG
jgi:SAM-dependent methyltransferase